MTDIVTPNFTEMDIAKLRQYASHLRVAVPKDATKKDIVDLLSKKLNDRVTPELVDNTTTLKPGYARITVLEDPMPGASNYPIYVNANGYQCTIPRGKEVRVPKTVVEILQNAKVNRKKQTMTTDQHGREMFRETSVTVPSYPFTIHEVAPGEAPMTSLQRSLAKTFGPRKAYADMFGRWPRPGEITRAIEQGLITLKEDDRLQDSELAFADSKKD
jgi:hypothetical protein